MLRLYRLTFTSLFMLGLAGCASLGSYKPDDGPIPANKPQAEATTQISPQLLREELAIVKQQLLAIHPDPFARIEKAEFEQRFESVKSALNYPLSRAEFFLRLAPLLASLRDVHTFITLPKDRHGFVSQRSERLFPLAIVIHQNKLRVAADLTTTNQIPAGAEIVSINRAPGHYLLEIMRTLTARETDVGQDRRIQLDFSWLISAMGYADETYEISYLWQDQLINTTLPGLQITNSPIAGEHPLSYYGYSRLSSSTSLLWLNDFNENPEIFDDFLQNKFTQMGEYEVENLIIDVRYNQGGLSQNLKNLLSRISQKEVYWANKGTIRISENFRQSHFDRTRQRRKSKLSWGLQWLPLEWTDQLQHSIWWSNFGENIVLQLDSVLPADSYKPKRVWVLTNGYCYSACSLFVASVNHYQLGRTLGESAGSLAHHQFGYPLHIVLPHSGLSVTLPAMRLEFSTENELLLIEPLEMIERTVEDIHLRRDPVLLKALREADNEAASKLGKN